jgi:hypothetical protein
MRSLPFTRRELQAIQRACGHFLIDDCTPPYLQDFIAARLADDYPEVSTKVRRLEPSEMDDLCQEIRAA